MHACPCCPLTHHWSQGSNFTLDVLKTKLAEINSTVYFLLSSFPLPAAPTPRHPASRSDPLAPRDFPHTPRAQVCPPGDVYPQGPSLCLEVVQRVSLVAFLKTWTSPQGCRLRVLSILTRLRGKTMSLLPLLPWEYLDR